MGIYKQYKAGTLDLISSDYTRPEENASEIQNILFTGSVEDPDIEKRKGLKRRAADGPVMGQTEFQAISAVDGIRGPELLGFFADNLKRRTSATLTVSYSGSAVAVSLSIWFDPATSDFRCTIIADGVTLLNQDLGLGYDEASPYSINSLDTAISALTGFTATVSGTGTLAAACLDNVWQHDLKAKSLTLTTYEWTTISNATSSFYFPAHWSWVDQPEFENISHVSLNDCLYFYCGGRLLKYDGKNVFLAGCDKPTNTNLLVDAAGSIAAGTYQYILRLVQQDNAGNIIYGPWSDPATITTVVTRNIQVDATVTSPTSAKQTTCNSTMGAASSTIPVAANVFEVNDLVAVWDRATSSLLKVKVTSVAAGSITIAGSAQLTSGDTITLGTTVQIARTVSTGTTFYIVGEKPYDWLSLAVRAYIDNVPDATTGEEVILPEFDFGSPPNGNYVAVYKGGLVCSGFPLSGTNRLVRRGSYGTRVYDYGAQNDVWFGDYENPEGFPIDGSFTLNIENNQGDVVRGMVESGNSLIVFKGQSCARVNGDPTDLSLSFEWLSKEVGCIAGHTIKEVNGSILFLSTRGFAIAAESRAPDEKIGYVIRPIIDQENLSAIETLKFLSGHTTLLPKDQLYLTYFPAFVDTTLWIAANVQVAPNLGDGVDPTVNITIPYHSPNSRTFVYDYLRNRWSEWEINALGGLCEYGDVLHSTERRLSGLSTAIDSNLLIQNTINTAIMFNDHDLAINGLYGTAWYIGQKPTVPKQFPRVRVSSIQRTANNDPTLTVRQQVNFLRSDYASVAIDFDLQANPYGVVAQSRLGDGKFRSTRLLLVNNEINTNMEVAGWELEVDSPYIDELKT